MDCRQLLADRVADWLADSPANGVSPMARKRIISNLHQLTVREILAATDGDLSDGGGLILRIRGQSASWVLRYTAATGKRREMGLGVARIGSSSQVGDSVTTARDLARDARDLLQRGVDPIDERDVRRIATLAVEEQKKAAAKRERTTLARAARGNAFIREYCSKTRGGFLARPTNRDYLHSTLHARRDGLIVIGVLTAYTVGSRRSR